MNEEVPESVDIDLDRNYDFAQDKEQLQRDWDDLEEDDEYVFYPVALYDSHGQEYQSFTMYQRVEDDERARTCRDGPEDEVEPIFWPVETSYTSGIEQQALTMYKRVDKKIRPVSTTFSPDYEVKRNIPQDPMSTLPALSAYPPAFTPTAHLSHDRLKILGINTDGFLSPDEEKLFVRVMELNQQALAFEDAERGTFKDEYFSPYKIATVPHVPWEYKNIPIPPGILQKVIDMLKLKMEAGVYEMCQSSYRSRWFCVLKKNGKLRIVHDLQPLNKVSVRDAGMLPIVDDFVEGFAGRQCYTVFDLYWGFDARRMEPESRDMTAFMTPLELLRITSMPTGYTNSPAEFQKCMVFILRQEIPHIANIFIDDLPIKGPASIYPDKNGEPERLEVNPGIRRFVWEHAQDVHRIMHKVGCAGATFSALKVQCCRQQALIVGQLCSPEGRTPDTKKVSTILNWPALRSPQEVRRFLGLCGTVRIWIRNYSEVIRPLTELYRRNHEFVWDERRKQAFSQIKQLVSTAPALRPINYDSREPVILSVDSS
jgi:hypothetical protein